jgi:hypothetical protein
MYTNCKAAIVSKNHKRLFRCGFEVEELAEESGRIICLIDRSYIQQELNLSLSKLYAYVMATYQKEANAEPSVDIHTPRHPSRNTHQSNNISDYYTNKLITIVGQQIKHGGFKWNAQKIASKACIYDLPKDDCGRCRSSKI